MNPESAEFDDRLRQVPPPAGLVDRLRTIPYWAAADLDAELNNVELPADLLANLHSIVEETQLDEALRNVPVSQVALARARVVADQRSANQWLGHRAVQWTIAASLILLTWSGYLSAIVTFAGRSVPEPAAERIVWLDQSPLQLDARQLTSSVTIVEPPWESPLMALASEYEIAELVEPVLPTEFVSAPFRPPALAAMQADWDREAESMSQEQFVLTWNHLNRQSPVEQERPTWELAAVAPASTSSALWHTDQPQPHLFMVDRSPVFSPGNDRRLETSEPWLSPRTTNFNWATAMAAAGRFPTGESLQLADFLAALDYNSLRLSAGEVQWQIDTTVSSTGLVHNGVRPVVLHAGLQAGPMLRQESSAVNIQLAVDTSASMSTGRLEIVRMALDRFFEHLGEQDRVSLLPFAEQTSAASPWLTNKQPRRWRDLAASLTATTSDESRPADWGNALHEALAQAIERADYVENSRQRVVLITDSQSHSGPSHAAALKLLIDRAQAHAVEVHVMHLGPSGETRRLLTTLAEATGGRCLPVSESFEVSRTLAAILAGGEVSLARQISLTVRFDPKLVAAYRLVGDHAPSIVAGNASDSVTLAAGESLTAMYEIWLRPEAAGSPFTVAAQWEHLPTRKVVQRKRSFTVAELASAANESPTESLQLASLAVATVAALRPVGSPAETRERIRNVLQGIRGSSQSLTNRADVRRLIRLLEASQQALVPAGR